jgi:serine protease AprX
MRFSRVIPVTILLIAAMAWPAQASAQIARMADDLIRLLTQSIGLASSNQIQVIIEAPSSVVDRLAADYGVTVHKRLFAGAVLSGTAQQITALSTDPQVTSLALERQVAATQTVETRATGADLVWPAPLQLFGGGVDGFGVGVAIIDSGIAPHPDFDARVLYSHDLVNPGGGGGDAYGHGTHVAGIVAGSGLASLGQDRRLYAGIAPGARLINVRVLGADGTGVVSDVMQAIDWCIRNQDKFNIRVINLSLGVMSGEAPQDDPLVRAVQRAVDSGLVVIASAGNFGKLPDGTPVVGGIVSPGRAADAITVGAVNTNGTVQRSDDVLTTWTSRGPAGVQDRPGEWLLKPDLVAPGNAVISAAQASSALWAQLPERRSSGVGGGYLRLSGTSMAAPAVAGAAALLLQARPRLTPAEVKFALQFTAERMDGYGLIEQGAGSLNVPLALAFVRARSIESAPTQTTIAGQKIVAGRVTFTGAEGHTLVSGDGAEWGDGTTQGTSIVWGSTIIWSNSIVWGSADGVWGSSIVWGSTIIWSNTVWGDTIIWSNQAR